MTKSTNDDLSPSLTQILKNPKPMRDSFTYPNNDKASLLLVPLKSKAEKTVVTDECSLTPKMCRTPVLRNSSGSTNRTKSLGMRRRLSSLDNSPYGTSASLRNRTPKRQLVHKNTPSKKIKNDEILVPCPNLKISSALSNCANSSKTQTIAPCKLSLPSLPQTVLSASTVGDSKSFSVQRNNLSAESQSFVGFKTAGNKNINISNDALKKAQDLYSSLLQEENKDQKLFLKEESNSPALNTFNCGSNLGNHSPASPPLICPTVQLEKSSEKELHQDEQFCLDSLPLVDTQLTSDLYKDDISGEGDTRVEKQSLCSSPVLSVRRKRRNNKKKKPNHVIVERGRDDKTRPIYPDDTQCSFDDDDLALLAVDLSARFEEEEPGQDRKRPCDKVESSKTNDICTSSVATNRNPPFQNSSERIENIAPKHGKSPNKNRFLPLAESNTNNCNNTNILNNRESTIKIYYKEEDIDNADMSIDDDTLLRAQLEWEQREEHVNDSLVQTTSKVSEFNKECREKESCAMPLVGFYTASEKPIAVSEDALKKAQSLLQDDEITNMDNTINCYVTSGFSTASKKSIPVSDTAFSRAQSLLCEEEIADDTGCRKSNTTTGFKTASNKPVLISDTALKRANELLEESEEEKLGLHNERMNVLTNSKDDLKPLCLYGSSNHQKLTNLFQSGKVGKKKCNEFKLPRRSNDVRSSFKEIYGSQPEINSSNVCLFPSTSNRNLGQENGKKLLGVKCYADSQIAVSDESLLKAAEMLEEVFS